ncbi:unnamed protein product [Penicillium manginii]
MEGCFFLNNGAFATGLPQVGLNIHVAIISGSSRTTINKTYKNPSTTKTIREVFYTFPVDEGSTITGFVCQVDTKRVTGVAMPLSKACEQYKKAKATGQISRTVYQFGGTGDILQVRVGNLPPGGSVQIEITLVAELKQDALVNGLQYRLPMVTTGRYVPERSYHPHRESRGIFVTSIVVDIIMENSSTITSVHSPGHSIEVQLGRTSLMPKSTYETYYATVKYHENDTIATNFDLHINATKQDPPCAFLERHSTLPNQRALMVSLMPKFHVGYRPAEIIFVIDRSESMMNEIPALRWALEACLKLLPPEANFNILSFGTRFNSLWQRSKLYSWTTLDQALRLTRDIEADYGGTDILQALKIAVGISYKNTPCDILLLTGSQIQDPGGCIEWVNETRKTQSTRFFTLAIGNRVSQALTSEISRAGGGFAQTLLDPERCDQKIIRMMSGILMRHLSKTTLQIDSEKIDVEVSSMSKDFTWIEAPESIPSVQDTLPELSVPDTLRVPTNIPPLFPYIRSTFYVLFSGEITSIPKKITIRSSSTCGPLELEIPVQDVGEGETIHQLAAKKAICELEEDGGWIYSAKDPDGNLITVKHEIMADKLVQNECERLGVRFQIAGKHCSLLAVCDAADEEDVDSDGIFKLYLEDEAFPVADYGTSTNFYHPAKSSAQQFAPASTPAVGGGSGAEQDIPQSGYAPASMATSPSQKTYPKYFIPARRNDSLSLSPALWRYRMPPEGKAYGTLQESPFGCIPEGNL